MKKLISNIKSYFRNWKKRRVAKVATDNYIKAAKLADERCREQHRMMYVISAPDNECALIVCNSNEFIDMRKKLDIKSKDLTLSMLKRGCWYHSANNNGIDRLNVREMMKRKQTYVMTCLDANGLLDKKPENV